MTNTPKNSSPFKNTPNLSWKWSSAYHTFSPHAPIRFCVRHHSPSQFLWWKHGKGDSASICVHHVSYLSSLCLSILLKSTHLMRSCQNVDGISIYVRTDCSTREPATCKEDKDLWVNFPGISITAPFHLPIHPPPSKIILFPSTSWSLSPSPPLQRKN